MNSITISEQNNVLVVDSRMIAKELGIKHKTFLETIRKHQATIERHFGHLPFETAHVQIGNGAIREDISHYWLIEDQATFLMTLSRNTPKVIDCKVKLVEAFSAAKKKLEQSIAKPFVSNESRLTIHEGENGIDAIVPHNKLWELIQIAKLREIGMPIHPDFFDGIPTSCLKIPLKMLEYICESLKAKNAYIGYAVGERQAEIKNREILAQKQQQFEDSEMKRLSGKAKK